eukprot:538982-Prymnesium_polylepis.1
MADLAEMLNPRTEAASRLPSGPFGDTALFIYSLHITGYCGPRTARPKSKKCAPRPRLGGSIRAGMGMLSARSRAAHEQAGGRDSRETLLRLEWRFPGRRDYSTCATPKLGVSRVARCRVSWSRGVAKEQGIHGVQPGVERRMSM